MKRLWLCLGLLMVVGGGSAATMGYLAAREAATMQTLVASNAESAKTQATTRKSTAGATTRKGTSRSKSVASATRKPAAAATPSTRNSLIANANAPSTGLSRWRGMMWWGAGMLAVGIISVAYSIHEMRPKEPPTGADELLNDAPPF